MYRTLDDPEGRNVVVPPEEGVSLATLGVMPYLPPDPAWEDDDRMPAASDMETPGISFADLVRPTTLVAEPGVWRDDRAPRYAGWGDPERDAVPYDRSAAALGAFHIPGLPDDAADPEGI